MAHDGAMISIEKLHDQARSAAAADEAKLCDAAELLAGSQKLGATQRQSAKAIRKSQQWVSQLLPWRKSGYKGGAFDRSDRARSTSPASRPKLARATPHNSQSSNFRRPAPKLSPGCSGLRYRKFRTLRGNISSRLYVLWRPTTRPSVPPLRSSSKRPAPGSISHAINSSSRPTMR